MSGLVTNAYQQPGFIRAELGGSFIASAQRVRVATNGLMIIFNPVGSGRVINVNSFIVNVVNALAMAAQLLQIDSGYIVSAVATPNLGIKDNKRVATGINGVATVAHGDSAGNLSNRKPFYLDPRGGFVTDRIELIQDTPLRLEEGAGWGIQWAFGTFTVNAVIEYEEV